MITLTAGSAVQPSKWDLEAVLLFGEYMIELRSCNV